MPVAHWVQTVFRAGIDFVYPRTCQWCARLLPEESPADSRFCVQCVHEIAPEIPYRCLRCSAPVGPNLNTMTGCIHCKRDPMHYVSIASLGPYQEQLRLACLKCKQPGQAALADSLTALMSRRNEATLRGWKADLIIPVPHHWVDRLRLDHASIAVAESLGRLLKLPVERQLLFKVRRTRKQSSLPASARQQNLRSAFRVARNARLDGRKILLADDVLTTGITADRCTQALLKAGATSVHVAVLARSIGG